MFLEKCIVTQGGLDICSLVRVVVALEHGYTDLIYTAFPHERLDCLAVFLYFEPPTICIV